MILNNMINLKEGVGSEGVEIELVAYGPGIHMLKADSPVKHRIADALKSGVQVNACQNTMNGMKLTPADMQPEIGYVPSGVVEVMKKQQQGWAVHPLVSASACRARRIDEPLSPPAARHAASLSIRVKAPACRRRGSETARSKPDPASRTLSSASSHARPLAHAARNCTSPASIARQTTAPFGRVSSADSPRHGSASSRRRSSRSWRQIVNAGTGNDSQRAAGCGTSRPWRSCSAVSAKTSAGASTGASAARCDSIQARSSAATPGR